MDFEFRTCDKGIIFSFELIEDFQTVVEELWSGLKLITLVSEGGMLATLSSLPMGVQMQQLRPLIFSKLF